MSYPMDMDDRAREIYAWNKSQGFYDRDTTENVSFLSEKLLLIVSEVAEAQDALRNGDRENEAEEIADVLIRTLDYCAYRGINPDFAVRQKMAKNRQRPRLHGRAGF